MILVMMLTEKKIAKKILEWFTRLVFRIKLRDNA
jgi:hypothetical protein